MQRAVLAGFWRRRRAVADALQVANRHQIRYTRGAREAANHMVEAARVLLKITENYANADPLARELGAIEHACDEVAHTTMDRLNKTFITPLDREDIHALILKIDDVVDLIEAAANRMAFFRIERPTSTPSIWPNKSSAGVNL